MDAGGLALLHIFFANQHLMRTVGRENRRGDGQERHRADKDHADDARLAPEQPAQGSLPEGRRATEELLLGLLPGECGGAALQGRDCHSSLIRGSRNPYEMSTIRLIIMYETAITTVNAWMIG